MQLSLPSGLWNEEEWLLQREPWFHQIDEIFNIDIYLRRIFRMDEKIVEAEREVAEHESDNSTGWIKCFENVGAARSWLRRLRLWAENLRQDLIADSVPAPGQEANRRWLLYRSDCMDLNNSTGAITCFLCKKCCAALSHVDKSSKRKSVAKMPELARANGLWHGPDPPELQALSYCEAKVINLARVYVSVKRIFLDRSSYARTSKSEAPLYHQKNVVAYPQNPDAALRAVGMNPQNLAKMVIVQFVGEDRRALRQEADLSVSVDKLRQAFRWLSQNSWPFMDATKHHELWETGLLDKSLEDLLSAYATSVGSTTGGVPCELLQGASRIPACKSAVVLHGPANCTEDQEDVAEGTLGQCNSTDMGNNCAAALDGGVDDITPVQLWDAVMKKYKVAQACEKELVRLNNEKDESKRHGLQREQAVALAAAVEALSKLQNKENREKVEQFFKQDSCSGKTLEIPHSSDFLRSTSPLFWFSCFVRLFPRGDCLEKCPERQVHVPARRWAKCLLTRCDSSLWRLDVEFVASLLA